ncbi:DNA polymerase I [Helicobacter fennelliae]|uniref:DNA polymerase I n=1 Tax=Helicobacter fennelliae TaxID=215 RepID=UPI000E017943|nr:DNA polymerase I [Helicobacter fennelliae]STQ83511.1 DNA polymerase I [Helicobacter fennelliae]
MQQLTIIDTFGFFFRSFYALPPLQNSQGFPTGLLMGFANLIMKLHSENTHDFIAFALEGDGINTRKITYPLYKANRVEIPQDMILQLPIAIEWIDKMGLASIKFDGYEADDAIASLVMKAEKMGIKSRIISHDKDLYQLINDNIFLYDPIKNIEIHEQECFDKFGVFPKNFIDYQSLVGDSSDNVPGIKGIGSKTASKLIGHFGSLDAIYQNLDDISNVVSAKISNLIKLHKEDAYLSKKLVTLKKDLPLDFDLKKFAMPMQNPLKNIIDEMDKYEFIKIIQRLTKKPMNVKYEVQKNAQKSIGGLRVQAPSASFSFESKMIDNFADFEKILSTAPKDALIAYDCETTSLNTFEAQIVGFSFCIDGKVGYYVPVGHKYLGVGTQFTQEEAKKAIALIFEHSIIGHNLKYDLAIANRLGIMPQKEIYDSMILAWLCDSVSKIGLDEQMKKWFKYTMIKFVELVDKNQDFSSVNLDIATQYAAEDAVATMALFYRLKDHLIQKGLGHIFDLAKRLEFPFIYVLLEMERNGIAIDIEHFEVLSRRFSKELLGLEKQIFELSGSVFNLNSPKQLGNVLFETLGLKAQRQIKGGYSTDEKTLLALMDAHPIICKIMEYREIAKLKNTYVEPILKLNRNHRIHSLFLQTGTATGRLSSKSPNIQNIPVRTEQGREIRQGFVASRDDSTLLSIDYSQIELRLLAHFSLDPVLLSAFANNLDIHLQTAKLVFGEECAKEKRDVAKSINFGLIYGMGAQKLAQTLKISFKEAREYIQNYFESFPTVKNFLKQKEEEILNNGYSQTLLGHRRYFDFSRATDFMRANYLREGINSIFQGSAADLIKLAMLKIHQEFKGTAIKMLLQVHDELIFELPKHNVQENAKRISEIMNGIYTLKVPLQSNIAIGRTWADLK